MYSRNHKIAKKTDQTSIRESTARHPSWQNEKSQRWGGDLNDYDSDDMEGAGYLSDKWADAKNSAIKAKNKTTQWFNAEGAGDYDSADDMEGSGYLSDTWTSAKNSASKAKNKANEWYKDVKGKVVKSNAEGAGDYDSADDMEVEGAGYYDDLREFSSKTYNKAKDTTKRGYEAAKQKLKQKSGSGWNESSSEDSEDDFSIEGGGCNCQCHKQHKQHHQGRFSRPSRQMSGSGMDLKKTFADAEKTFNSNQKEEWGSMKSYIMDKYDRNHDDAFVKKAIATFQKTQSFNGTLNKLGVY
jgi:hypothetical protein